MNCTDWNSQLNDYVDGDLDAAATSTLENHLATCAACRAELAALRSLRADTVALPRELAPARDLWAGIRNELPRTETSPAKIAAAIQAPAGKLLQFFVPLAAAAAVALLSPIAQRHSSEVIAARVSRSEGRAWTVAPVAGAPRLATRDLQREGKFSVGQWLETDANSRAKISVGAIGEVSVAPNSRIRLINDAATDHRLELARGSMSAFIWAPPRLFFVETPAATAVDLGCAYTLDVDDQGRGELYVTSGYVALEHGGRESIVPAGVKCLTRPGTGPGTPFVADAPAELRAALERFDFSAVASTATSSVAEVLAHIRPDDAVTLWHLLTRTDAAARGQVFDALHALRPAPEGVTCAGILAGDTAMRTRWAESLGLMSFAFKTKLDP
jgi:hypothetical protein